MCSAKIAARRALEVSQAVRWIEAAGGQAVMVTLTVRHNLADPLVRCWEAVAKGWDRVVQGRGRQTLRTRFGFAGYIRVVEVTRGDSSGWHVHVHALVLLDRPVSVDTADALGDFMFARWSAGVSSAGMSSLRRDQYGNDVGVTVRRVEAGGDEALGDYFSKATYWNTSSRIALEMTHGLQKSSRRYEGRHRSPMEILQDITGLIDTRTGELAEGFDIAAFEADLRLFREYERVSKGKQQLTWSKGLKVQVGLEDLSDDEIAEEDLGDEDLLLLPVETWRVVRWSAFELLEVAEIDGLAGARAWLQGRRLDYTDGHTRL